MLTLQRHDTDRCPCDLDALVAYRLADDPELRTDRAGALAWGLRGQPGRIESYVVLEVSAAGGSGRKREQPSRLTAL